MNQRNLFVILTKHEVDALAFWVDAPTTILNQAIAKQLRPRLIDEVDQILLFNPSPKDWPKEFSNRTFDVVTYLPGVTDNPASSFRELLAFGEVHSARIRFTQPKQAGAPLPFNSLIERRYSFQTCPALSDLLDLTPTRQTDPSAAPVKHYSIHQTDIQELLKLSKDQHWALSEAELIAIKDHYTKLNRDASDVEIEVLAQTWSEHCKHKIFAADIECTDETTGHTETVNSLFKTYIAQPTTEIRQKKNWAVSVFKDNAGIVRFHEGADLCIKVETHNSPSALDPYGGALTGILGVNRDILGTGLGAKPIANTNVLFFGMPDHPEQTEPLPPRLLHPREILKGVHHGIQDGGNKSGIPTVNGAMIFDDSYSGKPLVFCGTVGVLPRKVGTLESHSKNQKPGDLIIMVGGRVGMDGLHGATSSSLAMDANTPSSMVQIGDPLTQKRVMDFMLEARDLGLYHSVTDNGAGGLSSSIGEMCEQTGGAYVYLDQVPLKYPGLSPWQIFVSESQERMTLATTKENWAALQKLARDRSVEATVVGEFTDHGKLTLKFHDEIVGDLELYFLHNGCPKMKLRAKTGVKRDYADFMKAYTWRSVSKNALENWTPVSALPVPYETALLKILSHPSIASKEKWVRQYDHEVKAATVVKPFDQGAPNDAGLIWMGAHSSSAEDTYSGAGISAGLAPEASCFGGHVMATLACDEAIRNLVVMGCDPARIALCDNFSWPDPLPGTTNPDADEKLGLLVETNQGIAAVARAYATPCISGKDSMKNDYIGQTTDGSTIKISVLPTLLMTAMGYHPDVRRAIKPHARSGSIFCLLGAQTSSHYFGTTLMKTYAVESVPHPEFFNLGSAKSFYENFYQATLKNLIESAHDLSEGGLLVAMTESMFLRNVSTSITLTANSQSPLALSLLFSEDPGRILVSVVPENIAALKNLLGGAFIAELGPVVESADRMLQVQLEDKTITFSITKAYQAWQSLNQAKGGVQ